MAIDFTKLAPSELETLVDKLEAAGQIKESALALMRLAEMKPDAVDVHVRLGRRLLVLGASAQAEAALKRAIALQREPDPSLYGLLGFSLWRQKKHAEALPHLRKAPAGEKADLAAQKAFADVLYNTGHFDESFQKFSELRALYPRDSEIPTVHASRLIEHGKFSEAAEAARAAIDLGGSTKFTYCVLGNAYACAGDLDAAYQAYCEGLEGRFESPLLHTRWVEDLLKARNLEDAITWLEAKAGAVPDTIRLYHVAKLAFRAGKVALASEALERIRSELSNSILFADLDTRILAAQGRWREATAQAVSLWNRAAAESGLQPTPPHPPRPLPPPGTLHKVIYSSVEIVGREFDFRLLIACQAAKQDLATVLASGHIFSTATALTPGVFLLKTMNAFDKRRVLSFAQASHRFAALDEEALGWVGTDENVVCDMDPQIVNLVDVVMANSDRHRTAMANVFPALKDKIHVTGNARIELVDSRFMQAFEKEAQGLQARFGQTVLICTNFGTLMSAYHDYFGVCKLVIEAANRPPQTPQGQAIIQMGKDAVLAESRGAAALIDFIPKLAAAYPHINFILRPHPVENATVWKNRFSDLKNVVVTSEGALQAWLKAAKAMIYFAGCMTGFEAYLSNAPAIRFNVGNDLVYPTYGISAHINPSASTSEELIERVGQAVAGELAQYQDKAADEKQVLSQMTTGAGSPSARTAEVLAAYLKAQGAIPLDGPKIDHIRSTIAGEMARLESNISTGQLFEAKRITASLADVQAKLSDLQRIYDDFAGVKIVGLAKSAFLILPADAVFEEDRTG